MGSSPLLYKQTQVYALDRGHISQDKVRWQPVQPLKTEGKIKVSDKKLACSCLLMMWPSHHTPQKTCSASGTGSTLPAYALDSQSVKEDSGARTGCE